MGSDGLEMHGNGSRWHVLLVKYSQSQKNIVKAFALRNFITICYHLLFFQKNVLFLMCYIYITVCLTRVFTKDFITLLLSTAFIFGFLCELFWFLPFFLFFGSNLLNLAMISLPYNLDKIGYSLAPSHKTGNMIQ